MHKMSWQDRGAAIWKHKNPTLPEIIFVIALGLLLLRLGIALFEYARLARAALAFPFPLDYGEGPILDQVLRLAQLENIYLNNFATPPYTVSNYPPLFHLIQVPFAWLFGPAYWYGRLISILSAITAAVLIGLILHTLTTDWVASTIGALALLSFPYTMQGSVFNRVDTLAFALSLGGLYIIVRPNFGPNRRRGLWITGLVFTAAVFTSQKYALAAPLAAFAWLLRPNFGQQRRQALTLVAIMAGCSLGLFFVLNLLTRGGFYLNTVLANMNPFSWYPVTQYVVNIYLHAGYLVIGCIIFIIVERLGEATRSWPLVTAYLFGAALAALTAGIAGSSFNPPYEVVAALCLGAGAFIAWSGENHWLKAAIVFVLAMQVNGLVEWSRQEYIPPVMEKVASYREVAQIAALVREAPGPVLADEYMGLIPLYGRRLYFQPFEYKQLREANLWSEDQLIASIQRKEFSAILLYLPRRWNTAIITRWTPEMRDTIYAHYKLEETLAQTFVYLPQSDSR
jgi:4-amino-4-deoxy-L-arabinose transferase-like glycosyltransferase